MKFQYASDLHLEFYKGTPFTQLIEPVAPILVLAGDIGIPGDLTLENFLSWCSKSWKWVIWVFGNHEYFNLVGKKGWTTLPSRVATIAEREAVGQALVAKFPNVYLLQNKKVVLGEHLDYEFYGCTLWSKISEEVHAAHQKGMADFKCIAAGRDTDGLPVKMTLEERHRIWREQLERLVAAVKRAEQTATKLIVVTHHLPTFVMIPDAYEGSETNEYYANQLHELMKSPAIKAWICGHSHGKKIIERPTLCCLNARGYPGEQVTANPYTKVAIVDFEAGAAPHRAPTPNTDDPVEWV